MKKWLIGCGGCLGVVVVLASLGVVGTAMWCGSSVDNAKTTAFLMLTNTTTKKIIFAFDHELSKEEAALFTSTDLASPEFSKSMEKLLKEGMSSGGTTSNSQVHIESVTAASLENGKSLPLLLLKLYDEDEGFYTPLVAALAIEANDRMVLLVGMDPNTTDYDEHADFSAEYKALTKVLVGITNDTALDDRLVSRF